MPAILAGKEVTEDMKEIQNPRKRQRYQPILPVWFRERRGEPMSYYNILYPREREKKIRLLMHLAHMPVLLCTAPVTLVVAADIRPRVRRHDASPVAELTKLCF